MTAWQLRVDLHFYWHAGSGSGSGTHLDALCERDHDGLPFIAGRHLKGLLRHAIQRAEQWGWLAHLALPAGPQPNWESLLFGTRSQAAQRYHTLPGMLILDDARLSAGERAWIESSPESKAHLFTELYSTAIHEQGAAALHTLRGMEAALPMTLHAPLACEATALDEEHRQQQQAALAVDLGAMLERVLPLIDAVGAHRSRGLGEATLSLHAAPNKGGQR